MSDDLGIGVFRLRVMISYGRASEGFFIADIEQILECNGYSGKR